MPNPQGFATGHVRHPNKDAMIADSYSRHAVRAHLFRAALDPPAAWDSWTLGWVGPIKDQKQCGSCWNFSGTRTVEGTLIKAGVLTTSQPLSEQYTMDCYSNGGCNGDDNVTVLTQAKKVGLPMTADYGTYTASSGKCKYDPKMKLWIIDDWGFCDGNGGNGVAPPIDIKTNIMASGIVGCAVDAGFSDPGTGIISGGGNNIDHDVTLTGWQDTATKVTVAVGLKNTYLKPTVTASAGWWWMDNSWGTGWGDGGRARIKWGAYSIGTEAVFCKKASVNNPIDWSNV